jgi:NAD(P)-dependent dehydrogenase (short-subunit alcohol dehydrogenase family)
MHHYIEGKTIIVTGGSSGFGLEAARMLLEMNAKVVITGRNLEKLHLAEASLGAGGNLLAVQADATSSEDWKRLIKETIQRFARLDVLVNNHGAGGKIAPLEDMEDSDIEQTLAVNLTSVAKGCRAAIQVMKPNGRGHIVNVSSACAHHSWANWSVYTAAKAGLVSFTRCVHLEMAQWGGKATSFIPGAARTGFCDASGLDSSWMDGYPGATEFARTLVHCVDVPENCFIEEVSVWGTKQVNGLNPF